MARWTNWFVISCSQFDDPHGTTGSARRSADPDQHPDKIQHVAPLFPLEAVDEYYKQLVPNGEVTLPGSTCESCDPKELTPPIRGRRRISRRSSSRLGGAVVVTHSQAGIMGII
jgi:hypothetical protein